MIKAAPSILAADILRMGEEVERVLDAGADAIHIDIMDGHFVPNLSFGPPVVAGLRRRFPEAFLDVHLMLSKPERYIDLFLDAGADALTVHLEAQRPKCCLKRIRERGKKAGLSVKPATGAEQVLPFFDLTDFLLVMTVEPGFGGQKLMPSCVEKVSLLRRLGYEKPISVDGGVTGENAATLTRAGADILVMGTASFKAEDPRALFEMTHRLPGWENV